MQVTLTTPPHLIGQRGDQQFDCPWLGRGGGPSGPLGTTITIDSTLVGQALRLGFSPAPVDVTATPQTVDLGLTSSAYQFG